MTWPIDGDGAAMDRTLDAMSDEELAEIRQTRLDELAHDCRLLGDGTAAPLRDFSSILYAREVKVPEEAVTAFRRAGARAEMELGLSAAPSATDAGGAAAPGV